MQGLIAFISADRPPTSMAPDEWTGKTTITDRHAVTIPAPIRRRLDIESGDKLRWAVTEDGTLEVEVLKQRTGVFEDFDPVDMGATDGVEDHDTVAVDVDETDR